LKGFFAGSRYLHRSNRKVPIVDRPYGLYLRCT
jgi:hypothetical protein